MNIFELKMGYNKISKMGLIPILELNDGTNYNLSEKSVKGLKFKYNGLVFVGSFDSIPKLIKVPIEDVKNLIGMI